MELYTQTQATEIARQIKRSTLLCAIVIIVLLLVMVVGVVVRSYWLIFVPCLAAFVLGIFAWGLRIGPERNYLRMMRRVLSGEQSESTGTFLYSVSELIERDGVEFSALYFAEGTGKDACERKVYLDAHKTLAPLTEQKQYTYRTMENILVGLDN